MNMNCIQKLLGFLFLVIGFSACTPEAAPLDEQRINLALRQTAHHLYIAICDSTSQIPPVKSIGNNTYEITLDQKLAYDTLPFLLGKALQDYRLSMPYVVSVRECSSDTIVLGYSFMSFNNSEIPCLGREQERDCNRIQVTFRQEIPKKTFPKTYLLTLIPIVLILPWFLRKKTMTESKPTVAASPETIDFGQCRYNPQTFNLEVAGDAHQLTFREAKLLQFLIDHKGEILKREQILKSVWEDEGLIVGRSLDVFISRLRKILKADETVAIKTIHGVGYRLEC